MAAQTTESDNTLFYVDKRPPLQKVAEIIGEKLRPPTIQDAIELAREMVNLDQSGPNIASARVDVKTGQFALQFGVDATTGRPNLIEDYRTRENVGNLSPDSRVRYDFDPGKSQITKTKMIDPANPDLLAIPTPEIVGKEGVPNLYRALKQTAQTKWQQMNFSKDAPKSPSTFPLMGNMFGMPKPTHT